MGATITSVLDSYISTRLRKYRVECLRMKPAQQKSLAITSANYLAKNCEFIHVLRTPKSPFSLGRPLSSIEAKECTDLVASPR